MEKNNLFKKGIVVGIVALFICVGFAPIISGYNKEFDQKHIIEMPKAVGTQDEASVTCYAFGKTAIGECDVVISTDDANSIYELFEQLKYEMIHHPLSMPTQMLKMDFIDLLYEKGLIPNQVSKSIFHSLLDPLWIQWLRKKGFNPELKPPSVLDENDSINYFLCTIAGSGAGWVLPPVMLPRPRILSAWYAFEGKTSLVEMITGNWLILSDAHMGVSLGFFGIGLAFAFPGLPPFYGFAGYSVLTTVTAGILIFHKHV
ncbi:MAG: hypothetical protein KAQ84_02495 [Thermoplasmatales archaeon]|nr:hypothetical protein [Thermoplasmatales archaeon]